uniref:EF-hand domain-containing protein n=1 Tax=Sphenodon punctatus TaxID=8508 RepID=A0A8D0GFS9_SPHPU
MSLMEKACEGIIDTYHWYSARKANFDTLTKGELKQFLEKEFINLLASARSKSIIDTIFEELDKNKDNQVDFEEFMSFATRMLIAAHEKIHKDGDDGHGHGHGHSH